MQIIRPSGFPPLRSAGGFTLTELLVVIAIIGFIGVGLNSFDYENATDKERRDRMATKVTSIIRHAKTAAVSGRTSSTWGCSWYAIAIGEKALTGSIVSFSDTWAVVTECMSDSDSSAPSPIFGDAASYYVPAITAYDKSGWVVYRIANASDFGGNVNTSAKAVAILVEWSNLKAYPLNCANVTSCVDYAANAAVKLKINVAYKQAFGTRKKELSKDVWVDLRTGNVETKDPVAP